VAKTAPGENNRRAVGKTATRWIQFSTVLATPHSSRHFHPDASQGGVREDPV